jgi:hypothetical protein
MEFLVGSLIVYAAFAVVLLMLCPSERPARHDRKRTPDQSTRRRSHDRDEAA